MVGWAVHFSIWWQMCYEWMLIVGDPSFFFFGICSTKGGGLTIHSTMGDFAGHLLGLTSPIPSPTPHPRTPIPSALPFRSFLKGWLKKPWVFFFGFSDFCLLKSEPWNQSHLEFEISVDRFFLVCCLKRFRPHDMLTQTSTLSLIFGFSSDSKKNHDHLSRRTSPNFPDYLYMIKLTWHQKPFFEIVFQFENFAFIIARSFNFVLGPRISRSNEDVCGWKSSEQFRACLVFLVSLENFTYILEQVWNFEKLSRATQMFFWFAKYV